MSQQVPASLEKLHLLYVKNELENLLKKLIGSERVEERNTLGLSRVYGKNEWLNEDMAKKMFILFFLVS